MAQPSYSSANAYIAETFFTIFFDIPLDPDHPPSLSSFAVQVNGTNKTVASIQINSADNSIKITFASATLVPGDIIDFVYTDPTIGNDVNAVQGLDGTDAASFSHSLVVAIARPGPAAPSTPTLDPASDSGVAGDFLTNDNTPAVSGTADANATIKLYDTDGTTLLGTTTADGTGKWSLSSSTLSDGSHTLKVTQTDGMNQTSNLSNGLSLTIDTISDAPTSLAVAAGSDSGTLGDGISNVASPVINGVSEAFASISLYDTDGSTKIGTATADKSGKWSVTNTSNLTVGVHTLTAIQTDVAGNVSKASADFSYTLDTIGPVGLALTTNSVPLASATNGSTVSSITSTDITAVTYGFAVGNGIIDADNGKFTISGNALKAAQNLSAGTYHIYLSGTDAAGNDAFQIFTFSVTNAPTVSSIVRAGAASSSVLANAASVDYTVTFSESVTGVDTSDFSLSGAGTAAGKISALSGSGSTYTVTVNTLAGDGSLRLDLNSSGTGIKNGSNSDILTGYTSGETYTLDHTAPSASSTPAMTAGTDTGSSSSDAITKNVTPVFTGTGEANASITLFDTDGSTILGSTSADGSGNWSITASKMSEGGHTVTVKQTDQAGNVSVASSGLAVQIDTTAPSAPATPVLSPGSDSGTSGDFLTNVSIPVITGTAEANAIIKLYDTDGTTLLGTTTADGSGKWSITSSTLVDGSHSLTVKQTDQAGNVSSASSSLTIDIDTSVPSTPGTPSLKSSSDSSTLGDGITNIATPTLVGTGTVGDTVTLYDTDGSTVLGTAVVDGSGNWSVSSSTLADGVHTVTVKQSNQAGTNSSSSKGFALTIDTTAPVASGVAVLSPGSDSGTLGDSITNVSTPIVTGSSDANALIKLYDSDGTTLLGVTTADGSGKWSITTSSLTAGIHNLTSKQTDAAGNVSSASASLALTIDNIAPSAPLTPSLSPSSDSGVLGDLLTAITTPVITGKAEANAMVKLYDSDGTTLLGTTTADGSGNWSITSGTLVDGLHNLTVKQVDVAGNSSSASSALALTINTKNSPPVLTGTLADQATLDTASLTPFATVSVTDNDTGAGETVSIKLDSSAKGSFTAASLAATGFSTSDGGQTYTHVVDTPSLIQAALRGLVFQPATGRVAVGSTETTTFTISVNDGVAAPVSDSLTSVISTATNLAPTGITLSGKQFDINSHGPSVIGALSTLDPNPGDSHTYQVIGSNQFRIDGQQLVAIDPSQLGLGEYSVMIRSTDATGAFVERSLSVLGIDSLAPQITGLSLQNEGQINTSLATFLIRFNKNVNGVDLGDFELVKNGVDATMLSLVKGDGDDWLLTVGQIQEQGSLALKLKTGNLGITDAAGKALINPGFSSASYTVSLSTSGDSQDDDRDAIPHQIESQVPNLNGSGRGDGNGDGVADDIQGFVSSLVWQKADAKNHYLTMINTQKLGQENVITLENVDKIPAKVAFDYGAVNLQAVGGNQGGQIEFTLFSDKVDTLNGIWLRTKTGDWQRVMAKQSEENGHYKFSFSVKDGSQFDLGNSGDGAISLSVAPGFSMVPKVGDKDGDGIPDALEVANGTNPNVKDNAVLDRSDLFVKQLYRDVLFRESDSAGQQFWQNQLDSGAMSREQLANSFLEQKEFQDIGNLARLYFGTFGRLPDRDGLAYWIGEQKNGMALKNIASSFVASSEFQSKFGNLDNSQFIDQVYLSVLQRSADAAGKSYWLASLNAGASRGDVLMGFTESAEFKQASQAKVGITLDYLGLIADMPENSTFTQLLNQNLTQAQIIAQLMENPDYWGRFV